MKFLSVIPIFEHQGSDTGTLRKIKSPNNIGANSKGLREYCTNFSVNAKSETTLLFLHWTFQNPPKWKPLDNDEMFYYSNFLPLHYPVLDLIELISCLLDHLLQENQKEVVAWMMLHNLTLKRNLPMNLI